MGNGWQFSLKVGTAPHPPPPHLEVTSLKNCLSTFKFFRVCFFLFHLCISRGNRIKLKEILNLNRRLKWNICSQICKLHLIFLSTLVIRDQSKWRANKNKYGEEYSAHPKVRSKSNKSWKKNFNPSWIRWFALQNKLCRWSLKCAKDQNCGLIRTYGGQVSHLLIHLSSLTFSFEKIRNHSKPLKLLENTKI